MKRKGKSIKGFLFASLIHQSDILMLFWSFEVRDILLWFILLISPFTIYSIEYKFLNRLYVNINKNQTNNQISTPISLSWLLVTKEILLKLFPHWFVHGVSVLWRIREVTQPRITTAELFKLLTRVAVLFKAVSNRDIHVPCLLTLNP